jgi:adenylate cyclase
MWSEKSLQGGPNYAPGYRIAAASNALVGRVEKAQKIAARLCQLDPGFRVSRVKDHLPFRRPEDLARYEDGLRKAGLPE